MRARARIQINLAVSQVVDIKQVANFPDIVFPILWFEEVSRSYGYIVWEFRFRCFECCFLLFTYECFELFEVILEKRVSVILIFFLCEIVFHV